LGSIKKKTLYCVTMQHPLYQYLMKHSHPERYIEVWKRAYTPKQAEFLALKTNPSYEVVSVSKGSTQ